MRGNWLGLKVILGYGSSNVERIALSLVHPRERIDIPVSAIVRVEAHGEVANPHVEVCFTPAIRDRVCRLTRQIVDEPVEIIVGGECVSRPIVREPLCTHACFRISANDLVEAHALAHRLRTGWRKAGPRAIP